MARLLALLLMLLALPASACLWDRDTLQEEAKGKLDTVRAITGWFDRYPPRYYEMRIERVLEEIRANPDALDLYDDAAVAFSRLGEQETAIHFMTVKHDLLKDLPGGGPADDRYRYLSNLGTFHLIRWITTDESVRSINLDDLKASETYIAQALQLNPDAHFGREKYQLMLIQWLLADPDQVLGLGGDPNFLNIQGALSHPAKDVVPRSDFTFEEARKGITGLIQLGAAWQSVDTFQALQMCLHGEQNASIAYLAYLRHRELGEQGSESLHPSPEVREEVSPIIPGGLEATSKIERFYKDARAAADKRDKAWLAYQEERFAKGMHPDTHPGFWNAWKEPAMPELPGPTLTEYMRRHVLISFLTSVIFLCLLLFVTRLLGRKKGTKKAPATATP